MNKNDSPKISNAELERLIQTSLKSTILTDEEVADIADSPKLWWNLQSRIADEKVKRTSWFFNWRWQTAIAGAFVFLFIAIAAFRFSNLPNTEIAGAANENKIPVSTENFVSSEINAETVSPVSDAPTTKDFSKTRQKISSIKTNKNSLRTDKSRSEIAARKVKESKSARPLKTETATEFIALSYLPASESGQIVRVKVPRSMLVSLGVSNDVERGKEMVNAEVIVGDDGAARAIRFLNE